MGPSLIDMHFYTSTRQICKPAPRATWTRVMGSVQQAESEVGSELNERDIRQRVNQGGVALVDSISQFISFQSIHSIYSSLNQPPDHYGSFNVTICLISFFPFLITSFSPLAFPHHRHPPLLPSTIYTYLPLHLRPTTHLFASFIPTCLYQLDPCLQSCSPISSSRPGGTLTIFASNSGSVPRRKSP